MATGRTIGQLILEVSTETGPALNNLNKLFGVIRDGVSEFARFDTGVREVATLLGQQSIATGFLEEAQQGAQNLAFEFGTLTTDSIPALYQAISARVPRENAFSFLETANQAAIAGVTTLDTAVRGISAAINAYGSDVLNAADASDALFVGVRFGITTFEQLSNNIGTVSPLAASLGVTFDEVVASMAAMTAQGVSTAQAATRLNAVLTELSRESSDVSGVFMELTGQSFPEFIAAGGSLAEAIRIIEAEAQRTDTTMVDMFNRIEAGQGVMLLSGESAGLFEDALQGMADKSGETADAFETMAEGLQFQMNRLFASLEQVRLQFFEGFGPPVIALIDNILPVIEELLPVFEAIGEVAGQAFGLVGESVFSVVGSLSGPLTDVLSIVADLILRVAENVSPLVETIGNLGAEILVSLTPTISNLADLLGDLLEVVGPVASVLIDGLGEAASGAAQLVVTLSTPIINLLQALLQLDPMLLTVAGSLAAFAGSTSLAVNQMIVGDRYVTRFSTALRGVSAAVGKAGIIAALVGIFSSVSRSAEESALSISNVGTTIDELRTGRSVAGVNAAMDEFNRVMERAADTASREQGGLVGGLDNIGRALGEVSGLIGEVLSPGAGFDDIGRQWGEVGESFSNSSQLMRRAIADLAVEFEDLDSELSNVIQSGDAAAFNQILEQLAESSGRSIEEMRVLARDILPESTEGYKEARSELTEMVRQAEVSIPEFVAMRDALGTTNEELLAIGAQGGPQFTQQMTDIIEAERQGLESTAQLDEELLSLAEQMGATGEGAQMFAEESVKAWQDLVEGIAPVGQVIGDVLSDIDRQVSEFSEDLAEDLGEDFNLSDVQSALEDGEEAFKEFAEEAGLSSKQSAKAWEEFEEISSISLSDFNSSLEESITAMENFNINMAYAAQQGGQEFAEYLGEAGPEALQAFREGSEAEQAETIALFEEMMLATGQGAQSALTTGMAEMPESLGQIGQDALNNMLLEIGNTEELLGVTDLLTTTLDNGLVGMEGIAAQRGSEVVAELINNLKAGNQLTAEELEILKSTTDSKLVDWSSLVEREGEKYVRTLRNDLAQGNELTSDQLAALNSITNDDLGSWANIIAEKGDQWLRSLLTDYNNNEISFDEMIEELERAAKSSEPTIETELDNPTTDDMVGTISYSQNFLNRYSIDVPSSIATPTNLAGFSSYVQGLLGTVTIPTRYGDPGYGVLAPGSADGGIHDSPFLTWVGETGQKEVIIPLERPQRAQQLAEQSGLFDVVNDPNARGGRGVIIQPGAIVISTPMADPALVAEQVMDRLASLGA